MKDEGFDILKDDSYSNADCFCWYILFAESCGPQLTHCIPVFPLISMLLNWGQYLNELDQEMFRCSNVQAKSCGIQISARVHPLPNLSQRFISLPPETIKRLCRNWKLIWKGLIVYFKVGQNSPGLYSPDFLDSRWLAQLDLA